MSFLTLSGLQKAFGGMQVVRDFNLAIAEGEFVSLLGPSGCGKTTVLRMVAGFETPTAGSITIGGHDMVDLPPQRRAIGMVFQAYALFPNLTVAENVAFGLKVKGVPAPERKTRVAEMLALIGLPQLGERYPFQLSGGQQQRVALARALAPKPRVLLLDEPLSALDAKVRVSLRTEIRAIQRDLGITTIFVTHDQEEALSMSDRIAVMNQGIAEQIGAPAEIYNRPATRFVAAFVGTLNQFEARVADPASGRVEVDGQHVDLGRPLAAAAGGTVMLALRPEAIRLGAPPGTDAVLRGRVQDVSFMGSVVRIRAALGSCVVSLDTFNTSSAVPPRIGETVDLGFAAADVLLHAD